MLTNPVASFFILYFIYYMKMKKKNKLYYDKSLMRQNHSNPAVGDVVQTLD